MSVWTLCNTGPTLGRAAQRNAMANDIAYLTARDRDLVRGKAEPPSSETG